MITSLTEEQIALFPSYRDKWVNIGMNTDPLDLEKAKIAARLCYEKVGLVCPETFYVADSPVHALEVIQGIYPEATKSEIFESFMHGNHEAGWLSYYDYMLNVLDIKECEIIQGLLDLSQHCGWWSAFEDCVVFQHRPVEIHLDQQNRIHNDNGPCIRYRDNFSIWAIDGHIVTEQIVMSPETLTVDQINKETNADIRSIMLDRYGWINYIKNSGAKLIDSRKNDVEGTMEALYETTFGKRLVATCVTGRIFSMGVPENHKTCVSAQSWLGHDRKVNVIGRT
jgi:hypothetical protein